MFDLQLFINGFETIATPTVFFALMAGTILGIVVGAIPGLTATMAIALLIPFTFSMPPIPDEIVAIPIARPAWPCCAIG